MTNLPLFKFVLLCFCMAAVPLSAQPKFLQEHRYDSLLNAAKQSDKLVLMAVHRRLPHDDTPLQKGPRNCGEPVGVGHRPIGCSECAVISF